jgi:DNA-binding NarL/FixJ family response regulator
MERKNLKTILVDDNIQFRTNLKYYIESDLDCKVIAEASNGIEFLKIPYISNSDIVLMDIEMGQMDGFEATKRAIWLYSYLKVIALTMHVEKVFLIKLIESGFKGCVFKTEVFKQLPKALTEVITGKLYLPDGIPIY